MMHQNAVSRVGIMFYVERSDRKQLRRYALEKDTTVSDLLRQAVQRVLTERDHPVGTGQEVHN